MRHEDFCPETLAGSEQLISRAEILGAFSYALDLTEGQPQGHSLRCCWIGMHVGREIGLSDAEITDLYYTLLLKDIGCSSNAARICELYLTDDRHFKRDFKWVNGDTSQILKFVISHTGRDASVTQQARALLNVIRKGPEIAREMIQTRCSRGADIARKLRFSESVADGIHNLDEHWDGSGLPQGLKGKAIPVYSRIALLAQVADVFFAGDSADAAVAEVESHRDGWFDPALVDAFVKIAQPPEFWTALASDDLEERLLALEPAQHAVVVDEDYLDDIAAAFGEVVDAKSPYTFGHSGRVAWYADRIAEQLDYPIEKRRWLVRGALLHDIGKLGVSNTILDKPAKLDDEEWSVMRNHAGHTQEILNRISAFEDMAPISAAHHERLDGTGYPLGLDEGSISLETRIISVCDFYDALTADRPYRDAMPKEKALAIMEQEVGKAIDADCFAALSQIVAAESRQAVSG